MMRVVGQYKGCDIRITDLHMSETYAGFLALSNRLLEKANRQLVNEDIIKSFERIWGKDLVLYISDLEKIDYKKELPGAVVIAEFMCTETIPEGDGCCSYLFMAWYQEPDEDPFAKAISNLKKVVWEEKAKNLWP